MKSLSLDEQSPPGKYKVEQVDVYTDGSSSWKTRDGGIGIVILHDGKLFKTISEGFKELKTGQSELLAIYFALINCEIKNIPTILYCDSEYVIKSMTEWWDKWEKENFIGIKNQKLLNLVKQEVDKYNDNIIFRHIKGHTGNYYNEMADKLATKGRLHKVNSSFKDFMKVL